MAYIRIGDHGWTVVEDRRTVTETLRGRAPGIFTINDEQTLVISPFLSWAEVSDEAAEPNPMGTDR